MYNYTAKSKITEYREDEKYKVGDFTGEGVVGCDDFCWVISCYGKGISEISEDNKKFESRIKRKQVEDMLMKVSCKCDDYNTNTDDGGTFVCPADKKRYKNTHKNKENCKRLLEIKENKNKRLSKKHNNTTNSPRTNSSMRNSSRGSSSRGSSGGGSY